MCVSVISVELWKSLLTKMLKGRPGLKTLGVLSKIRILKGVERYVTTDDPSKDTSVRSSLTVAVTCGANNHFIRSAGEPAK